MRRFVVAALLLIAVPAAAAPYVFDRVVATVDGEVITLSTLEFEARMELLRLRAKNVVAVKGAKEVDADQAALAPLSHDVLAKNLALAIDLRLAGHEGERLGADVEQKDFDAAMNDFRQTLAPLQLEQFLAINEISMGEFEKLMRRDLMADSYLTSRAQLKSPVTEAQVDGFLASHRADVGPSPSKDVRDAVQKQLTAERNRVLVQTELRRLYARSKVRIVDPGFADADAPLRPTATGER